MSFFSSLFGGGGSSRVTGAQARELVSGGAMLVDVRTPGEFAGGHIKGSKNIPLDQLPGRLAEIPKDKPVVVCCLSGGRSGSAAGMLTRSGYTVHDLGPWSAW